MCTRLSRCQTCSGDGSSSSSSSRLTSVTLKLSLPFAKTRTYRYLMFRRGSLIFQLLSIQAVLLLFIVAGRSAESAWTNYDDILENELVDDQLRLLLGSEGLLRNRRRLVNDDKVHYMVNDACERDLIIYEAALDKRESWALKMLDSSSRVPVGLLQGHVIDVGMFDECTELRGRVQHRQESGFAEIHGRHCMYAIDPTRARGKRSFVLNPTLSICVPASCNAEDLMDLLHVTINATERLKNFGMNVISASCSTLPSSEKTSAAFFISSITALLYIIFLIFCTICDLTATSDGLRECGDNCDEDSHGIFFTLKSLSLMRNAKAIFSLRLHDGNSHQLPVIHGIRAISTCWIVLVHEYLIQLLLGVNVNVIYITRWISSWGSIYPLVGLFSVDTFLALSGFLTTRTFFKQIRSNGGHFNVFRYYLHRFIRLTFPLLALFVTTFVLLPGVGASGARYEWLQDIFVTGCKTKWWAVLLYFQNLLESDNYCLLHLWSLSVDMQLYWLSPFILYPLYKRPKCGLTILVILIFASAIISGSIVGRNKYSTIYFSHDYNLTRAMEAFRDVYQMPWTRASPWLFGVMTSYILIRKSTPPSRALISIGWLMTTASLAFCILGTRTFTRVDYDYNLAREVTFATLQRPLWAFSVCWIIYASVHDAAGPLTRFLSAKAFLPISRLSYSIYLVHIVLPIFQVGTLRAPKYFDQYSTFQSYIGNMSSAIVLALLFSLIFEVPILILEDVVFKKRRSGSSRKSK